MENRKPLRFFRLPVLAMCFSLIFSNVNAEITNPKHYFKLLCVGDDSTGFYWENGKWVRTGFKTENTLVKKYDISKNARAATLCYGDGKITGEGEHRFSRGCYNYSKVGRKPYSGNFQLCQERWRYKNGGYSLRSVHCDSRQNDMAFAPEGWFHLSHLHSQTSGKPDDDTKDSLSISVGKCSVIE
jgi:hypothetical protein